MADRADEKKAFIDIIPFYALFNKIGEVVGLDDLKFEVDTAKDYAGNPRPVYQSQDLADRVGFLTPLFKHIYIQQFNSEVNFDKDGHPYYWGTVAFAYEHRPCGTNGHTFMTVHYCPATGWEFRVDE